MTKKQFMEQIASKLGEYYSPDDYAIRSEVITKNNDTRLHGIIVQKRGDPMAPTIYVDDFYRDYLAKKMTLSEVAEQLCTVLKSVEGHTEKYRSFSMEFGSCKDKIIYRLISRTRNEYLLEEVPHLPFLDLAILFYVVCDMTERGLESMRISRELMEQWQTNTEQLMKLAAANTPRLFPLKMESMDHVITEYLGITKEPGELEGSEKLEDQRQPAPAGDGGCLKVSEAEKDTGLSCTPEICEKKELSKKLCGKWEIPMMILSNEQGINGASVLLYPDVIADLSEQFESDLYILPSSIHEVIVLPARESGMREDFSHIVRDINQNHVRSDEFLSDQAYFYDREKKRFEYRSC